MNPALAWAWPGLAALWGLAAAAAWALPGAADVWQWQRAALPAEAWRFWTAGVVHYSALHLAANLAGLAVVAAFGRVARLGPRWALAWLVAAPLTHALLLAAPGLVWYGGLSGVLHAGVAVAAVGTMRQNEGRARALGLGIALGLLAKVLLEAPWGPLARPNGHGLDVVPLAHAAGAAAGLLCGTIAATLRHRHAQAPADSAAGSRP